MDLADTRPTLIHADGVVVGDGPSLRDAAVLVSSSGVVVDVGSAASMLPRHAGAPVERVVGVVFPGLVNAHTHVELSALRGRVPGGRGFVAWVEAFVAQRSEVGAEEERDAVDEAVRELDRFTTAAVGDVSNRLSAVHALARAGIGGAVFHEVFGVDEPSLRRAVAALPAARDEAVGAWPTDDLAYVVAPHTLYTTHPRVVAELAREAKEAGRVTSLHLAEHAPERRALVSADGPMVEWLHVRTRGASDGFPWPGLGPVAYARALGALGRHVLSVHVTDARDEEVATLAAEGASVVLCPRSNLHIELKLPPLPALRSAGLEPALGTDSLASCPSLDVLAEARALADRFPGVPATELLAMATWNGARVLGRPDLGRIAKGAAPGLAAVLGELGEGDPSAFLLARVKAPRAWIRRRVVAPSRAREVAS
jgi:cytosine/adenosine deaminase-related metal-dependent hydrolase